MKLTTEVRDTEAAARPSDEAKVTFCPLKRKHRTSGSSSFLVCCQQLLGRCGPTKAVTTALSASDQQAGPWRGKAYFLTHQPRTVTRMLGHMWLCAHRTTLTPVHIAHTQVHTPGTPHSSALPGMTAHTPHPLSSAFTHIHLAQAQMSIPVYTHTQFSNTFTHTHTHA